MVDWHLSQISSLIIYSDVKQTNKQTKFGKQLFNYYQCF